MAQTFMEAFMEIQQQPFMDMDNSVMNDPSNRDIVKLYRGLLHSIKRIYQISDERIHKAIKSVFPLAYANVDYNKFESALAYTICYCPCHAEIVRLHTMYFLNSCPQQYSTLQNSDLNIVSFGGGLGEDILGFLNGLCWRQNPPKRINATIIDKAQVFHLFFSAGISEALTFNGSTELSTFLQSVEINPRFIEYDVDDSDEEVWESVEAVVKDADIVIMFSCIDRYQDRTQEVVIKTSECMKLGALLFLGEQESHSIHHCNPMDANLRTLYGKYATANIPSDIHVFRSERMMSCVQFSAVLKKTNQSIEMKRVQRREAQKRRRQMNRISKRK